MIGKVAAIAQAVLMDAVRRKVVWVVVVFSALLALAIPSLPSYGVGVVGAVYREVTLALMYVAALIVAVTLAAMRIPAEVERRTVFNVLSRDVQRWQYVFGTWLGMFVVVGIVLALFTTAAIGVGVLVYGSAMWRLFEGALGVWLEMGAIMALTVMLSTRFGAITSVVGGLVFAFVGHAVVGLLNLAEGQFAPWWLPSLDIFDVINPVAHGQGIHWSYAAAMVAAFAGWVVLFMLGGALMFARRDL